MTTHGATELGTAETYGPTRRVFHLAVIYVLGAIIGLAMAIPTALYLLIPPKPRGRTGWIDAGDIRQLTPGQAVEVRFQESRLDGWKLSTENKTAGVVKEPDKKQLAFGPVCPNMGCGYHWEASSDKFFCPGDRLE